MVAGVSSMHFLKLVEQHQNIGFWSCEVESGLSSASLGVFKLLLIDPTENFSLAAMIALLHPQDRGLNDDLWEKVKAGTPSHRTFRIIRHDRSVRWVESMIEVLLDRDGKPARALGMLVDITEQHELRQSLELCQERYRVLVRSVARMEWRTDQRGRPQFNSAWTAITGQAETDAANEGWLNAVHPDDRHRTIRLWREAHDLQATFSASFRLARVSGQYDWFHVRAVPMMRNDRSVVEWVGVLLQQDEFNLVPRDETVEADFINARQIRAARASLNWTLEDLSSRSGVSVSSIRRIEGEAQHVTRKSSLEALRKAFEKQGIEFTRNDSGRCSIAFIAD